MDRDAAVKHLVEPILSPGSGRISLLVGRVREQVILHEELMSAMSGHGRLILLGGEAGIGKTTLAKDLIANTSATPATIAIGRCYEAGLLPEFAPWHELLGQLPGGEPALAALPPPFGAGASARTAYQLLSAVAAYVRNTAVNRPLILLLEDVHWADRDTLELLEMMTRSLSGTPILLLATYRPEGVHRASPLYDVLPRLQRDRDITNLDLRNLSLTDTRLFVEGTRGPCSPELASYLHQRSEGHPLFLVELLRDLDERHLLPHDGQGRSLPPTQSVEAPARLQQLIAHRVTQLGAVEGTLLAVASIVGEEWELGVVEAVLEWPEETLLRALETALAADVIIPAGSGERYRFRHGLIREVLYSQQLARRRKRLHLRIGAILEQSISALAHGRDATLAYHFAAGEAWEQATHYSLLAGDAARQRFAGYAALLAYEQTLATLEQQPPAVRRELLAAVYERLGRTRLILGQMDAAEAAFERMLRAAREFGDRSGEGSALVWISYVQRRKYQPAASRSAGEAGLELAIEIAEPRLLALAHWNLGHFHEVEGNLPESVHHATESERLARIAADSDMLTRGIQTRAIVAIWHGHYQEAERLGREALTVARTGHDGLAVAAAHWRLGFALGEQGYYDPARRTLAEGIAHAETLGERYYLSKLLNTMGWLYNELGDPDTARLWNMRALDTVRGSHADRVTESERYTLLNLVSDELLAGRIDAAAEYLQIFEPLLAQHDYGRFRYLNRCQLLRADLALAQGNAAAALEATKDVLILATEKDMPKNIAKSQLLAGRARLVLKRPREAVDDLTRGVELADRLGHGSLRWQGRLWLGQARSALRLDPAPIYQDAMDVVDRIARDCNDGQMRDTFLASPLVRQLRDLIAGAPPPIARPAGLTAREVDVLRLLVRHQTDKEIAGALFLSPRTVNTHVANIFIKLEVANRREAAVAAARLGLG